AIVIVLANPQLTKVEPAFVEKWTGAKYILRRIPDDLIRKLEHASIHPAIDFPPPNPFLECALTEKKDLSDLPGDFETIEESDRADIVFLHDPYPDSAQFSAFLHVRASLADGHPKNELLLEIYSKLFKERFSSFAFFADQVGLNWMFSPTDTGFLLMIEAPPTQGPALLTELFQALKTPLLSKEKFERYKAGLIDHLCAPLDSLSVVQEVLKEHIDPAFFSRRDKNSILERVSYADFTQFSHHFLDKLYLEGFFVSSLSKDEISSLVETLRAVLAAEPYPEEEWPEEEEMQLEKTGFSVIETKGDLQGNAVLLILDQGPSSCEKSAAKSVLSKVLEDAFFDSLRTKQQTAYTTRVWDGKIGENLVQYFAALSSTYLPEDLLKRFLLFLEDYRQNLRDYIPASRFERIRTSQMSFDEDAYERFKKRFAEAKGRGASFDEDEDLLGEEDCLESLTYEEFLDIAAGLIAKKSERLAILVEGGCRF
ncbi:MAG: insulinase family protein, partial [Anaerolineae bacterium]